MTGKKPYPAHITSLNLSGITKVAMLGIGDPRFRSLWFGESDLVTPKFIRDAATEARWKRVHPGIHARGIQALRDTRRLSQGYLRLSAWSASPCRARPCWVSLRPKVTVETGD